MKKDEKEDCFAIIQRVMEETGQPFQVFIEDKKCMGQFEMIGRTYQKEKDIFSFHYRDTDGQDHLYVSKSLYAIQHACWDGSFKLCLLNLYDAHIEGNPERIFRIEKLRVCTYPRTEEENEKYWHAGPLDIEHLKEQYDKIYMDLVCNQDDLDPTLHGITNEEEAKMLFGEEEIEKAKTEILFGSNMEETIKKHQRESKKSYIESMLDVLNNRYSTFYYPDVDEWKAKHHPNKTWKELSEKEIYNFKVDLAKYFSNRRDREEVCRIAN